MSDPIARVETVTVIAAGGFVGASLRYLALGSLADVHAITLANVVGCFLLGLVVYGIEHVGAVGRHTRLFLTTGTLSSLTTYSGFAAQAALAGGPLATTGVVGVNYGLGFLAVLLGRSLARRVGGERP